jgi:DNA primase
VDTGCLSAAREDRRALLDKGLRGFPVVLGAAGLHLVGGFHIEQLGQTTAFGVRRDKAALSSGCEAHPAIRSSRKQSEQSWR